MVSPKNKTHTVRVTKQTSEDTTSKLINAQKKKIQTEGRSEATLERSTSISSNNIDSFTSIAYGPYVLNPNIQLTIFKCLFGKVCKDKDGTILYHLIKKFYTAACSEFAQFTQAVQTTTFCLNTVHCLE